MMHESWWKIHSKCRWLASLNGCILNYGQSVMGGLKLIMIHGCQVWYLSSLDGMKRCWHPAVCQPRATPARNTDGSHCSCRCCTPSRQRGCCAGRAAAGSGERDDDDASWKTVFFSLQWPADGCCLLHPGTPAVWLELKNPAIKHTTDGTFSIFHPALIKQPNNI